MITYREWFKDKPMEEKRWSNQPWKYQGWFLFGYVPLYIRRLG